MADLAPLPERFCSAAFQGRGRQAGQGEGCREYVALTSWKGLVMPVIFFFLMTAGMCLGQSVEEGKPGTSQAAVAPVKVEGGLVQGIAEEDLAVYKGVPFAAPPTGDLRWRAPQAVSKWRGVRKAEKYAPGCMQSMGAPPPSGMSEDCLYLNIWTPAKSPKER